MVTNDDRTDQGPRRTPKSNLEHPSRKLHLRDRGFGIGGGYERVYRGRKAAERLVEGATYGPLPPAGYYGAGTAARPFTRGEASFKSELSWYGQQYGTRTTAYPDDEH